MFGAYACHSERCVKQVHYSLSVIFKMNVLIKPLLKKQIKKHVWTIIFFYYQRHSHQVIFDQLLALNNGTYCEMIPCLGSFNTVAESPRKRSSCTSVSDNESQKRWNNYYVNFGRDYIIHILSTLKIHGWWHLWKTKDKYSNILLLILFNLIDL